MRIVSKHGVEEEMRRGTPGAALFLLKRTSVTEGLRRLAEDLGVPVRKAPGSRNADAERGFFLEIPDSPRTGVDWEGFLLGEAEAAEGIVLFLDGVTDPQNFGAILRCADQFRVKLVVSATRRSAPLGQGAIAASAGAHSWVPRATVTNLNRALDQIKGVGYWVYGATTAGEDLPGVSFPPKTALVMGAEGKGIGRLVAENCDSLVRIPTGGRIDSLNVGVATGIFLYAVRREVPFKTAEP